MISCRTQQLEFLVCSNIGTQMFRIPLAIRTHNVGRAVACKRMLDQKRLRLQLLVCSALGSCFSVLSDTLCLYEPCVLT